MAVVGGFAGDPGWQAIPLPARGCPFLVGLQGIDWRGGRGCQRGWRHSQGSAMNWRSVPIQQVIARYSGVELKLRGRELWGLCPFHADRSPSLAVNPDKGAWICRAGCGGGSGADFLMKLRGLSFRDAASMIEVDFKTGRDWQPVKRQKSPEMLLAERVEAVFNWCFTARLALLAELKRRGDSPPAKMILDLGRLEIITGELTGEPAQVANGLVLFGRWFSHGKSSCRRLKVG